MRRRVVAVAGMGTVDRDDPRRALAFALGRALVDARYRVLCGGLGGLMEEVARGGQASEAHVDGDVLGILPGHDDNDNDFVDIALPTGLGHLRNALVAHADALVAIGGGAGTLTEMSLAWIWDRPVLAYRVEGWSGRLADTRIDERREDRVWGVDDADEVIARLAALL